MELINFTNLTTPQALVTWGNNITGGILSHSVILALWLIIFITVSQREKEEAFLLASFISFIASVLLWGANLVSSVAVLITILATVVSIGLIVYRKEA